VALIHCKRCHARESEFTAETCWYCDGQLCYQCWEDFGHCGHPEAEAINKATPAMTAAQRAQMAKALWPDAEHLGPPAPEVPKA
jgi:hypothetical protein